MTKCGRCGGVHATAAEVRACYNRPLEAIKRTAPPASVRGSDRMTDKQRKYAVSLMESRGLTEKDLLKPLDSYDKRSVSVLINNLREMPEVDRPVTRRDAPAEPGMYRTKDGEIFKVQVAVHGSGRPYAKKLVVVEDAERDDEGKILRPARVRFDYAHGMVFRLTKDDRLTVEDARKFGALYGTCVRCGRTLTQEQSIERMMGPICYGKEYDPNFTQAVEANVG